MNSFKNGLLKNCIMKKVAFIFGFLIIASCSSTRFVDSWKNTEITSFQPEKLLVVGITNNLTARKIFEQDLKREFNNRNINAFESANIIDKAFTDSKKNEDEIDSMIKKLSGDGFDAVVITAVKGVEDKETYTSGYYTIGYHWSRFGRYYYRFQDVYYTPSYYEDYKVYTVETSIYNINEDEDKSLVWVGAFNIVNPQKITTTVKDYVAKIIEQLEKEGLIKVLN